MDIIHKTLEPISEYVLSFVRDTDNGWYYAEFGIPKSWEIKENEDIAYEIIKETDVGRLIKIFPKNENVIFDDLVLFIKIIVKTNEKIGEMEKSFLKEIEDSKKNLEEKIEGFYSELNKYKEQAFSKLEDNLEKEFKTATNKKTEEDNNKKEEENKTKKTLKTKTISVSDEEDE